MPCKKSSVLPELTSQDAGSPHKDKATLNLGRIVNTGYFNIANYTDANKIRIKVVTTATDHPDNIDGSTLDVTVNLKYSSQTATDRVTVTIDQAATSYVMVCIGIGLMAFIV